MLRRFYLTEGMTKTIRLFEICWIDHLLYYFSLMHCCGIYTDLLILTLFVHYFTNLLQNINHYSNI